MASVTQRCVVGLFAVAEKQAPILFSGVFHRFKVRPFMRSIAKRLLAALAT